MLLTTWRGTWPAAIVTGLLFGAAHVAVYPPELLLALAFFGVAACPLFWCCPAQSAPSASPVDAHSSPVAETSERSGKATAAIVMGIIGVLAAFLIPIVGLILGVIAIVSGRQAKTGRGQAQAGFVLGIIAVVGAIINVTVTAAIIAS